MLKSREIRSIGSLIVIIVFISIWDMVACAAEPKVITNTLGIKLVEIPAGEFEMGSLMPQQELAAKFANWAVTETWFDVEFPAHTVKVGRKFYMGQHEVTVGQFRQFVADDAYKTEVETDGMGGWSCDEETGKWKQGVQYNWQNTGFNQTDDHPVVNVTWNDANKFCAWLSRKDGRVYRLPTEAEWEYACKAGSTTLWWNGDDPEDVAEIGNCADGTYKAKFTNEKTINARDGYVLTAPVGRFKANPFGLYDMHGNVFEWCEDGYNAKVYGTRTGITVDPVEAREKQMRVVRGGSWYNDPRYARSASRWKHFQGVSNVVIGFRISMTP